MSITKIMMIMITADSWRWQTSKSSSKSSSSSSSSSSPYSSSWASPRDTMNMNQHMYVTYTFHHKSTSIESLMPPKKMPDLFKPPVIRSRHPDIFAASTLQVSMLRTNWSLQFVRVLHRGLVALSLLFFGQFPTQRFFCLNPVQIHFCLLSYCFHGEI